MGSHEEITLILDAIHSLRTDLNDRMDRQDAKVELQWKKIGECHARICPEEQHAEMERRVKSLEFCRAKVAGMTLVVCGVASVAAWLIETVWKK